MTHHETGPGKLNTPVASERKHVVSSILAEKNQLLRWSVLETECFVSQPGHDGGTQSVLREQLRFASWSFQSALRVLLTY